MIELLAPAGSFESLVAAVNAGADAVYIGGTRFGARAFAQNPQEDKFIEGLRYAHRYGARVYMTVNTLFKPREIDELIDYLKPYYEAGIDAVLVQDFGALSLIRQHFPDMEIHASTQMTVANSYSACMLKELGVTRVVPARELSLAEVKKIKDESGLEVETFVHGALCYSYSGQCLMSSLIGGRSGNRGRCAQPCRLSYSIEDCRAASNQTERNSQDAHSRDMRSFGCELDLLSLKDLCSISLLPALAKAGIDSFKIEGRMKSPRYTAGVTAIWRKYIDLYESGKEYTVDPKDMQMLSDLYNRGEFTDGYYYKHNGPEMMAWGERNERADAESLYAYLDEKYVNVVKKIPVTGEAIVRHDRIVQFSARAAGHKAVAVTGAKPDVALKRALTEDDIRKQLMKTGGTPYEFTEIKIDTDGESFMPVSILNEVRRKLTDALEEVIQNEYSRSRQ